jgi:hypothetical protein
MLLIFKRSILCGVLLTVFVLNGCVSANINSVGIEKSTTNNDVKTIRVVSDLNPVYTDLIYMAILKLEKFQISDSNPDVTLYFTKSRIEYHGLSFWNIVIYPVTFGSVRIYYHQFLFTVKIVSKSKNVEYIFDNDITRRDTNPEGGITDVEITKIIWDTVDLLKKG